MRKTAVLACFLVALLVPLRALAQLTAEEIAEREKWERFLEAAVITAESQPWKSGEAVTNPYEVTLEKDGVVRKAVWKDCLGMMKGYLENWRWEIAAYRLDKHLGLNMVPPTVEKKRGGRTGSCQIYAGVMDFKEKFDKKIETPSLRLANLTRAIYLQRAFDNLIYNEDRHQQNYRLTDDFRLLLIDHSRSFRTTKASTKSLLYDEKRKENPNFIMAQLPRGFVEKLRQLDAATLKEVVGEYLTDKEIEATMARRELMLAWLDKRVKELGEAAVLY
ncbi:MAG: hypothetical protein FJY79_09775 [Candidatus Aminicenantes bacterium]|nr:hypothetical protein [Candidatus Aminicenantes bacterium]